MRIYFKDISYQNFPVVFSLDSTTNSAKCLYLLAGSKASVNKEELNAKLINIAGIELVDHVAIIKDIETFRKHSPLSTLIEGSEHTLSANAFFSQSLPTPPRDEVKHEKEVNTPVSVTPLSSNELSLDRLLSNCPGETLVYEGRLKHNNEASLERLSALKIYSLESINLTTQVIKNIDYYVLRQWQMQLIRQLHEEIFAPSMSTFNEGRPVPEFVLEFFESMVKSVMSNGKYNTHDTAYELTLVSDQQPVPVEENYEIRAVYAKTMLQGFLYFTGDIPVEKLNPRTPELKQWLEKFKIHITSHKPKLQVLVSHLFKLTISVGLIEHDYKSLTVDSFLWSGNYDFSVLHTKTKALQFSSTTLSYALGQLDKQFQLPPHSASGIPNRIFSLNQLLKSSLDSFLRDNHREPLSEPGKEEWINSAFELIKQRLMSATKGNRQSNAAKLISHTIKTADKDLYVCDEWSKAINTRLHDISVKSLPLLSPRKETKYLERWKERVESTFFEFINQELEKQQVPDTTESTEHLINPRG